MKTYYKAGMILVAGIGVGAAAVEAQHAQTKPPIYVIGEIDVSNQEDYAKEYVPKVRAVIKGSGGRAIAATNKAMAIEGEAPKTRVTIQMWDSLEQYQAYRNSTDYKEARKIGDKYAKFRSYVVEGVAP
jgi:uncharacterized protein (DUF1330 family)